MENKYKFSLNEIVAVNNNFQNSINIQLDINKSSKVNSYIPTRSSVDILKRYISNIYNDTSEKSSILIGPYGKGKSHLLLVLLSVLSSGYTPEDNEFISNVIEKIKIIDIDCAVMLQSIRSSEKKFLPIIISNTQVDLNQAYIIALNEALKRAGIDDIAPVTYYTEALKVINNWKINYRNTYSLFETELKQRKINIKDFIRNMRGYDKDSLDTFKDIYPNLTAGSIFNPMINTDATNLYKNINDTICEEYGYSGMIIIFDEFSKYIEGHEEASMAADMKTLQDICELSNGSKGNQIHTILVAHKSIKEYGNVLSKQIINSFVGVEGRINEILFISSSQNNYELIQNAIIKKEQYTTIVSQRHAKEFVMNAYEIPAFSTLFSKQDYWNIVVNGCFPLLPVASYLLLHVSEKVAQNERTLFTFISKDEPHSMARFIKEHKSNEDYYITAANIYDYFKSLFKTEVTNTLTHNEWLKAEQAQKKICDTEEISVIKALAIINIVNRHDEITANEPSLALASGIIDVKDVIQRLREKGIIDYKASSDSYYFKNYIGFNFDKEISKVVKTLSVNRNYSEVLQKISGFDYLLPKTHNQDKCITRYFKYMFLYDKDFYNINSGSALFSDQYADGKIIYVYSPDGVNNEKCYSHLEKLNDPRIVVISSGRKLNIDTLLDRYLAIQKIKLDKSFTNDHSMLVEELEFYEEELIYKIKKILATVFALSDKAVQISHTQSQDKMSIIRSDKDFNRFISEICDLVYDDTPIINNEMINKNVISSPIKNARNTLISKLVNRQDLGSLMEGTSPEASIYRATLYYTGLMGDKEPGTNISKIISEIKKFILSCEGEKRSFESIYSKLISQPYGMRRGTIPIYIAYCLQSFEDTPIIYLECKEVPLSGQILSNINDTPNNYSLLLEVGTKDKMKYLDEVSSIFSSMLKPQDDNQPVISSIVLCMQRWMQSLSSVATSYQYDPNTSRLSENEFNTLVVLRKVLKKIECNPRELLLEIIPRSLHTTNFSACIDSIRKIKEDSDEYLIQMKDQVIQYTKSVFGKGQSDALTEILQTWYTNQNESAKKVLSSTKVSSFMSYLSNIDSHNEREVANKISKVLLDVHIENWNCDSNNQYKTELIDIKRQIEMIADTEITQKSKIIVSTSKGQLEKYYDEVSDDSTSYFLKNALQDAMDEFGDSLEINQKVSVLAQMISDLIK